MREVKEPVITLFVTPGGVRVEVDNFEELRLDQKAGFDALTHEVRLFAQALLDRTIKMIQTPRMWS